MTKRHQNGHLKHLSDTGQLQNLQSAGSNLNVQYHFAHIFILMHHTDLKDFSWRLLQPSCVSQLALRALLTGLALADWPGRDGRRREGLGSCSPSNTRDVNRHTKEFTVYPVYPSHKRLQLSEILSNSLSSLKFLKALSQSCMNLQPGSVEAALFVAALVPP